MEPTRGAFSCHCGSGSSAALGYTVAQRSMKKVLCLLALTSLLGAQPQRPRILGVAHIALFVSDIKRPRAFNKDFLVFDEPFKLDNQDGSLSLTFIKVNDRQYIELFPGLKPDADRLNHISIQTDDAEAM